MTKLSETQTFLLSNASQRANGSLLPLPARLVGSTRVAKPLAGLVMRGFAEERETRVSDEIQRTQDDVGYGLFITSAGEAAIGLEADKPITDPIETSGDATPPQPITRRQRRTKTDLVIALLTRQGGATLAELITATDWLPHTTRAGLTGLRKKGHAIERGKRGDATCYSIAAASDTQA